MNTFETTSATQDLPDVTWREQVAGQMRENYAAMQSRPEAGGLYIKAASWLGVVAVGAIATGVAFFGERIDNTNTVTSKGGTITAVYTMPPKECHGGFDAIINAKSEVNQKVDIGIAKVPTTNRASEEFTGEMTAEVCNAPAAAGSLMIDKATNHVTITIGSEDLSTVVYPTDPTDEKAWKSDVGILKAFQKNFGNAVKVLPGGFDYSGGDAITSKLRGQALLAASDVMSRSCGSTAWTKLAPAYGEERKKSFVAMNNLAVGAVHITEADVTVILPTKVNMANQYSKQFEEMKQKAEGKGATFTGMDPSKVVCKDKGVQVDTSRSKG